MEWNDKGILLASSPYGENFKILQFFTKENGIHNGLIRYSKKNINFEIQPGNQFNIRWKARLQEHLGTFELDLIKNRTSSFFINKSFLIAFNSVTSLIISSLPERERYLNLYEGTIDLIDSLSISNDWLLKYVRWELLLLNEVGFGLDLSKCIVTGKSENLKYVSPKSGCAVSELAGENWKNKLLKLPTFLTENKENSVPKEEIIKGLKLTEFFLRKNIFYESFEKKLPKSRDLFIKSI